MAKPPRKNDRCHGTESQECCHRDRKERARVGMRAFLAAIGLSVLVQGCHNAEREKALADFDAETDLAFYNAFPDWMDSVSAIRGRIEEGIIRPAEAGEAGRSFRERWRARHPGATSAIDDSIRRVQRWKEEYDAARAKRAFEDSMIDAGHRALCEMPRSEVPPSLANRRSHC